MNSEATQSDKSLAFLAWLEVNKKRIVFAAVAILVAGIVLYLYNYFAAEKEAAGTAAILELNKPAMGNARPTPPTASEYFGVAERFAGTKAAERAALLGASALFSEKKFSEAKTKFDDFAAKYPNSAFLASAAFGSAAALDGQNQLEPALSAYQQVVTRFAGDPVATQAKLAIAIIYEAKKQPDLALKMYDEIMKDNNAMFWRREVATLQGHLLVEHPELRETPKPINLGPAPTGVVTPPSAPAPVKPAADPKKK